MPIRRTALGTFANPDTGTSWTALSGVSLQTGDFIFVHTGEINGSLQDVQWNGITLSRVVASTVEPAIETALYATRCTASATGDVVLLYAATDSGICGITVVSGLVERDIATEDATGTSTTPSDAATQTHYPVEYFVAVLGTAGPPSDLPGTWQQGWFAGQRIGVSTLTLQEGYKIAFAAELSQASLTGITSQQWDMAHATYRGIVDPTPGTVKNPLIMRRCPQALVIT